LKKKLKGKRKQARNKRITQKIQKINTPKTILKTNFKNKKKETREK
jgi:hypothetical protein